MQGELFKSTLHFLTFPFHRASRAEKSYSLGSVAEGYCQATPYFSGIFFESHTSVDNKNECIDNATSAQGHCHYDI